MSNNGAYKRKFTYVCMTVRFIIFLGCSLQSIFKDGYCKIKQGRVAIKEKLSPKIIHKKSGKMSKGNSEWLLVFELWHTENIKEEL